MSDVSESIGYQELIDQEQWKSDRRIPDSRPLTLNFEEFEILFPNLQHCDNLHFLKLGSGYDTLPENLFELQQLTTLDISQNKLRHIPAEIARLHNLRHLDISDNKLVKLPEELFNLEFLEGLYLEDNVLQRIPDSICNLRNLRTLYLSHNLLSELPDTFVRMKHLREVALSGNLLTTINGDFSAWQELTHFYLNDNPLQVPPMSISKIALNVEEINALHRHLLNNANLKEVSVYDCYEFASKEDVYSQINPDILRKESLQLSEW